MTYFKIIERFGKGDKEFPEGWPKTVEQKNEKPDGEDGWMTHAEWQGYLLALEQLAPSVKKRSLLDKLLGRKPIK